MKTNEVAKKSKLTLRDGDRQLLTLRKILDIDMAEAVMRVEVGSKVSEMSSKELKRDLLCIR